MRRAPRTSAAPSVCALVDIWAACNICVGRQLRTGGSAAPVQFMNSGVTHAGGDMNRRSALIGLSASSLAILGESNEPFAMRQSSVAK